MQRDRQPEVMDQPGLDPVAHDQALQGLRRINAISRCVPGLFRHIESLARETPSAQLSVLELACGGGDTAIELAALARRRHVGVTIHACDLNPEAVRIARREAGGGAPRRRTSSSLPGQRARTQGSSSRPHRGGSRWRSTSPRKCPPPT